MVTFSRVKCPRYYGEKRINYINIRGVKEKRDVHEKKTFLPPQIHTHADTGENTRGKTQDGRDIPNTWKKKRKRENALE